MKAINFKLATFSFAALLLASCSDSNDTSGDNGGNSAKTVVGKEVTSITDAQELASRVINFNEISTISRAATRAAAITEPSVTQLTMPNAPTATGTEVTEITQNTNSGNYIVKSSISQGVLANLNNTNIYIENGGELTITNEWGIGENVNIYILNGGKLHLNSNVENLTYNIYAYKGSTFDVSRSKIYINSGKGIYIESDWTTSVDIDNRGKFYIGGNYSGSKFNPGWGSASTFKKDLTLKNDFDVDAPVYIGGDLKAQNLLFGSDVYIKGNVDISNNTYKTDTQNANVYIGGNLKAGDFINNQGSTTNIQGEDGIDLSKKDITINGTVNVAGRFKANTLKVQGTSEFYACGVETKGEFRIDSNTSNAHVGYLKAASIYQCASSKLYLNNNGYVDCAGTYENQNNGTAGVYTVDTNGASAYFKAKHLKFNGKNNIDLGNNQYFSTCYVFNAQGEGSNIYLDFEEIENNNVTLTGSDLSKAEWGGKNALWSTVESDYSVVDTKCGKGIKKNDDKTEEKKKVLDPQSDIIYDEDHTHNISATCIQPYNGKMYMSYHTRGKGQGACIEVFQTDASTNKTTLLQYLQDGEKALDYNHLMVDSKAETPQLYVVGNSYKSGAMLARIDLTDAGLMNTTVKETNENTTIYPLTVVPMIKNVQKGTADAKHDENCIVRDGDKLLIMSTRGYEVYDPNTLESLGNKEQPGKAKHITINGSDIATLYYTDRSQDSLVALTGKVEFFNAGDDILTATPKTSFEVGDIAPNHGKNTIAIDGNHIYVCRNAKGLSCYDRTTGAEVWNWTAPLTATTKVPQGYANGVTYDDNYIYLACGGYGLVVLDKKNMTTEGKPAVVAKKRCSTLNSANYVTLDNGYIYVAYGKSRLQVFKLVDKVVNNESTKM